MSEKYWKLGIIGWPLGYSLSPVMQDAALEAAGLPGKYKEYPVKPEALGDWMETEAPKLEGFNVTMPHKETVCAWLEDHPEHGEVISHFAPPSLGPWGAVNTVVLGGKRLKGYNTDGKGFLKPLEDRNFKFLNATVLLLGIGGTGKQIAALLTAEMGIKKLYIWNRHSEKAHAAVDICVFASKEQGNSCSIKAVQDISSCLQEADLVVNATSVGMREIETPLFDYSRLRKEQVVYDIVYQPRETALIRAARAKNCTAITGDEMLAAQGAAAFEIWTGVPAAKVLPAMKKALDEHFAGRG